MSPLINTQKIMNAIEQLTIQQRYDLDELLHDDPIGWLTEVTDLASEEVHRKAFLKNRTDVSMDSLFAGTTPADLKAIAVRSTFKVVD